MITGFEEYTAELDQYERETLLPAIVAGMKTKLGADNAISSRQAIEKMKIKGLKIDGPRFRKILHVIRVSGMLPGIVGTSKGYYLASNHLEWGNYIKSITERTAHLAKLRDAIREQYEAFKFAQRHGG